ncbi:MAG: hypothetical protein ACI9BH_002279, partial [Paracoccaceae bacterium]
VRQTQRLATYRHALRQMPKALPLSHRAGRNRLVLVMSPDPRALRLQAPVILAIRCRRASIRVRIPHPPESPPGDAGVILSTGYVSDFTNGDGSTNTNGVDGDAEFNTLAGTTTRDASFLGAKFIPTGDFLTIDFVISSEKYPE